MRARNYLVEHSDNPVIHKIHNLEPINEADLKELETVLWQELGTQQDYEQTTDKGNVAAFVRSLIGISQEAVNEKFGEFLNSTTLNSQQQEFIRIIINYVRENGDVDRASLVNEEPFNNYDLQALFGIYMTYMLTVVDVLHKSITAGAA